MTTPTVTAYSPHIFTLSNQATLTITGTNWDQNSQVVWFQLRDTDQASTALPQKYSFTAKPVSATEASLVIPAGVIDYIATNYKVFWGFSAANSFPTTWHSNTKLPLAYVFDVNIGGDSIPVQGGRKTAVQLLNVPEQAFATVVLTPKNVRTASWNGTPGKPVATSVDATLQILDEASRQGIIPFVVPALAWEGQWSIDVSLTLPDPDGDSDNPTRSTDPADTSPVAPVPGPGLIGYTPILGSLTDMSAASVPTMALSCTFSSTNPAPTSKLNQHIPDNTNLASWPSWLDDLDAKPKAAGHGDLFDYSGDFDDDGNRILFVIDGTGHYLLDEMDKNKNKFSIQIVDLNGTGRLINGSPIAIRVFDKAHGWRCARMDVNSLTYSTLGLYPKRWVIDSKSKEFPTKPEELFGIYQLVNNPKYTPGNDDANLANRASPCIIETRAPNLINFGIDKVILVPGAFKYPIDPYFVSSSLPSVYLQPPANPPQSFVWADGGYTDGFMVDASIYSVFFTGYISHVTPTDDMVAAKLGPSLNPAEAMSATCIGSSKVVDATSPNTEYLLMVASEPAIVARPANFFYTISKSGQAVPGWKPLMSNATAYSTFGSGQVSIVQIPNTTTVLLFQRAQPEIVAVFVCTINFAQSTLVVASGPVTLLAATVMDSVTAAYSARFGVNTTLGLVKGSWFNVLYQPVAGKLGSAGYHIFASPAGPESAIVHLWYPATSAAPFIDESKGTCLGVYGSMQKNFPVPTTSTTKLTDTNQPLLQIITGHLGSKVDLCIDSVTYGGADAVFIEIKAIKNGNTLTYGVREWSSFGSGSFSTSPSYTISTASQTLSLTTGATDGPALGCGLTLHWQPTTFGTTPGSIDASQVVDGDVWIFQILPYAVQTITSGVANKGNGTVVVDTSGSKLPFDTSFSCQFIAVYIAPPDKTTYGNISITNSKNTGPGADSSDKNFIVPNTTYALDSKYTATVSPAVANLKITVTDTPVTQDQWFITISKGITSAAVSGTVNSGDWGYPDITGTYSGPKIQIEVSCKGAQGGGDDNTPADKGHADFIYTVTPIDSTGKPGKPIVSDEPFTLKPKTKTNSAGVTELIGWTTFTLENGLIFGFSNITGLPADGDVWVITVLPSAPVIEQAGQRPVAAFSQPGTYDSAWIMAPTCSAGGRFLQMQIPIQSASTSPTLPTHASLLPLRSTLEPHITTTSSGNTLYFKGLTSPGLSWSSGIKKEVSTDSVNEKLYGLAAYTGVDYRAAHSGLIYSVRLPSTGLNDVNSSGAVAFSTLDTNDLITEPKMEDEYVKQLPPAGWVVDPLSTDLPAYKPTGWLAVFPQYRFHIGQVQLIADFATLFAANAAAVSSALSAPVLGATGRQVLSETFFVNTMIPVNRPDVFQQFQAAVITDMTSGATKTWLEDNGHPVNPFDNDKFYGSCVYNPAWATIADFDADDGLSKYLMQLSVLRQTWDSPPAWTMATEEGRPVPAYWRFRIGGPTCDDYLSTAYQSACYQNKYNTVMKAKLPSYYSTDPLWVNKFGSTAAASASVLLEMRLETSFQQHRNSDTTKLVDAIVQAVGSGGMFLLRSVMNYLAGRSILNSSTTVPYNVTSDVPVAVNTIDASLPPKQWEVEIETYTTPLMFVYQIGQGIMDIIATAKLKNVNIDDVIKGFQAAIQNQRVPDSPRPSVEKRLSGNMEAPSQEATETTSLLRKAELNLPENLKTDLANLRGGLKFSGFNAVFSIMVGGTLILSSIGSWEANENNGDIGKLTNAVNVIIDVLSIAQMGTSIADFVLRYKITKRLEAGTEELLEEAEGFSKSLKTLETVNKYLGGLMNIAFGVQSILSGSQELEYGGSQKLDGQLDVASGAFMVAGGVAELAAATEAPLIAIPGVGEILAGIGMEISIIKIWVGGAKSVGAFGQSFLNLIGVDGGMTEKDLTINYIRHVKGLAVLAKVSKITNKSPDPRDNGAETSPYIIEPFYSVADVGDDI